MSFGNEGVQGARPAGGGFDFGLVPTGQQPAQNGSAPTGRNRRRRSGPDRNVLIVVLVIVGASIAVLGGAAFIASSLVQSSEAQVKADSAAFCADIASTPGVLSQAGFGWPTEVADIPTTIEAMKAYQQRWSDLAKKGPPSLKQDLTAVATAADRVIAGVESSQSINRPGTLATMDGVTTQTVIPAWAAKYCD